MKKIYTTFVAVFAITHFSYAQWTGVSGKIYPTTLTDNVGIGTTTPTFDANSATFLAVNNATTNGLSEVGVGGNVTALGQTVGTFSFINTSLGATDKRISLVLGGTDGAANSGNIDFFTSNAGTLASRMHIDHFGNVGIGTTTPQEALSVNGNIRSKQVKVETNNWPDYVFKPTYILPSLLEVKTYIDQNQHLPDMPSAKEIEKDGLNLGEINKILTKKVEELTLYLIEKDNADKIKDIKLQTQQQQIDELKEQVMGLVKSLKKQ
jgi:hypothetical protein